MVLREGDRDIGPTRGAGGEIQITDAMIRLSRKQPFYGLKFEGRSFDCGSKIGFLAANIAYALERDDIALLALTGSQEPYAALKLSELNRSERKRQNPAELSESLRQYLYAKYVYRSPVHAEGAQPAVHLAAIPDQPEVIEGGRR